MSTGYFAGEGDSGDIVGQRRPSYAPPWPSGETAGTAVELEWNCRWVWGNEEVVEALDNGECSDALIGEYTDGSGNSATSDPGTILFMKVTDTDVYFEIVSDGWGGVIVAKSNTTALETILPLIAIFSQHIQDKVSTDLSEEEVYSADWFYYSPDTDLDINEVKQDATYLRNTVDTPRFNSELCPKVVYGRFRQRVVLM